MLLCGDPGTAKSQFLKSATCGSDGLRAEESHHEGVDPEGRGTGAGQRVCVSSTSLTRWVGR